MRFVYCYIEEAHPSDGWTTIRGNFIDSDATYAGTIAEPSTLDERIATAKAWYAKSGLTRELLVDDPATNGMCQLFAARPERLYILKGNTVLYQGGEGPFHYSVDDCFTHLDKLLQQQA